MVTAHAPRGRGRPRRTETDDRITQATIELLREQGPDAVNVASVAARSGVARTTIYRRYADRRALLATALQPVTSQGPAPEGANVTERIEWLLARTQDVLDQGIGAGGVAAVLTGSDPDFSAALRDALEAGLLPVTDQIQADLSDGTLTADVDPDLVLNLVLGAHLAESLRHGPPGIIWRRRTAAVLGSLLGSSPARSSGVGDQ